MKITIKGLAGLDEALRKSAQRAKEDALRRVSLEVAAPVLLKLPGLILAHKHSRYLEQARTKGKNEMSNSEFVVSKDALPLAEINVVMGDPMVVQDEAGADIVRITRKGSVLWKGREVESDEDFRAAMLAMAERVGAVFGIDVTHDGAKL